MENLIDQIARNSSILPARSRGNCRIWFKWEGKPVFLSAGTKKPKEAREAIKAKVREWYSRLPTVASKRPEAASTGHPWATESKRFIKAQHAHSKPGYKSGVAQVLRDFGKAAEDPDVTTMTKERFREVWEGVSGKMASHTKANWLGILGAFARFLEEDEIVPKDFTKGVKRPPRKSFGKRDTIYRDEWFQMIWDELPLWVRPIWEDHWFTGMDTKDLWEFEPHKHLIDSGKGWKIWKDRAKEGEIIDQPLSSKIRVRWATIKSNSKPGSFMYAEARKRYANEKSWGNQIRKALHAAQDRLKLPKLDIKSTRHTFATRHVLRLVKGEKNAPSMDQIRRWLGHAPGSRVLENLYLKLLSLPDLMD